MPKCDFCDNEATQVATDYCFDPTYLCETCSNAYSAGISSPEDVIIPIGDMDEEYLRAIEEDYDEVPN